MRKLTPTPLFIAAVISLTVLAVGAYLVLMILGFEVARADRLHTVQPTLPQKCAVHLVEHDPDTWDEVTETYPRNDAWENCMGVGRK